MVQLLADVSMVQQRLNATVPNTVPTNGVCMQDSSAAIWDETVVRAVFVFIHDHRSYIDASDAPNNTDNTDNTNGSLLDCLEKGHMVQHKWTLYRAVVLQKIQEMQDHSHQHSGGCNDSMEENSSSVQATQGSTGTEHGSTTMSDSLGSLSDYS